LASRRRSVHSAASTERGSASRSNVRTSRRPRYFQLAFCPAKPQRVIDSRSVAYLPVSKTSRSCHAMR
jgi:hypothetical protein